MITFILVPIGIASALLAARRLRARWERKRLTHLRLLRNAPVSRIPGILDVVRRERVMCHPAQNYRWRTSARAMLQARADIIGGSPQEQYAAYGQLIAILRKQQVLIALRIRLERARAHHAA